MRISVGLIFAGAVAVAAGAGCRKNKNTDAIAAQISEDTSDAHQTALDISESGAGGAAQFAPDLAVGVGSNPVGTIFTVPVPGELRTADAGCTANVQVLTTDTACGVSYNSSVSVAWNCTGNNGGMVVGSANIATVVTPDACPATSVTVAQAVGFSRTRSFGSLSATLGGTADITWSAAAGVPTVSKTVDYDLARQVTAGATLVRNQTFTGNRTVTLNFNGAGPADDERIVNGTGHDQFLLAGVDADVTETSLTFHRDCCYPVSGSFSYVLTGNRTGDGSVTFGPSCGAATNADGDSLALPACVP